MYGLMRTVAGVHYALTLPDGMRAELVCPDGRRFALQAGTQKIIT